MGFIRPRRDDSKLNRKQKQHSLKLAAGMHLSKLGFHPMFEVPLNSHLRADILSVGKTKKKPFFRFVMVEVKSSVEDFRRDKKWPQYLDYCDEFYFCADKNTIEIIQKDVETQFPQVSFISVKYLLDITPESAVILKHSELNNDNLDRLQMLYQLARSNCLFYQGIYKGLHKVNLDSLDKRYDLNCQSDLGGLV